MIPLKDDNPTRTVPLITVGIMAVNIAVFLWTLSLPPAPQRAFIMKMAVIPYAVTHPDPGDPAGLMESAKSLLTTMFLHGSLLHIAGNMLYLWIFGNNIEEAMGHGRFLAFYLVCGIAASLTQVAASPSARVPLIGASGAIAGVLGAYLVMYPAARVFTLVVFIFFVRVVPIPAVIVLGFWFLLQLVSAGQIVPGGVAFFAHIGGFVAGLVLIVPFRRRRPRQSLY